jgi:hypothetical protein
MPPTQQERGTWCRRGGPWDVPRLCEQLMTSKGTHATAFAGERSGVRVQRPLEATRIAGLGAASAASFDN